MVNWSEVFYLRQLLLNFRQEKSGIPGCVLLGQFGLHHGKYGKHRLVVGHVEVVSQAERIERPILGGDPKNLVCFFNVESGVVNIVDVEPLLAVIHLSK